MNCTDIYRWTPESAWTPITHFAEPRYYRNSARDSLGRYWITGFWVLDLVTRTKKFWSLPGTFYSFGDVHKTSKGDFIVSLDFSIYRTDGVSYTEIFSQKDLNTLPQIPGTFLLIIGLRVDANDRVWFHIGTGLVRFDL